MVDVQPFAYRVPRFPLRLPVEFRIEDACLLGFTKDLSDKGVLVQLQEPVLPGTLGRVRLQIHTCSIEVEAEVAYAELGEAGLRFRFASPAEQGFVETLVKLVSRTQARGGAAGIARLG